MTHASANYAQFNMMEKKNNDQVLPVKQSFTDLAPVLDPL